MTRYRGSCHCRAVTFEIETEIEELTTCDCSLCQRKGAVMAAVPEEALSILTGQDTLTLYQWNTGIAEHYFCGTCGIHPFHRKRSNPKEFAINARCLDDVDIDAYPRDEGHGSTLSVVDRP